MPALRRALEFLALERRTDARREWHALVQGLGEEELKAASWIARCRNWHGRAILTIARTPERDDLELRFPVLYRGSSNRHRAAEICRRRPCMRSFARRVPSCRMPDHRQVRLG